MGFTGTFNKRTVKYNGLSVSHGVSNFLLKYTLRLLTLCNWGKNLNILQKQSAPSVQKKCII